MERSAKNADRFVERIDELPISEAARASACRELDRAERAAGWTVRAMDRLDALIRSMRRATRLARARSRSPLTAEVRCQRHAD